jgi:hypothetical protein
MFSVIPQRRCPSALQAAHTLLAIVPRCFAAATSDLQATIQCYLLDVLAQQIMLGGLESSVSIDLRRLDPETLQILQASSDSGVVLGSVCRPALSARNQLLPRPAAGVSPRLGYLGYSGLINITLQRMTLMRSALVALSLEHLRLFWGVLDAIQMKRRLAGERWTMSRRTARMDAPSV